MQQRRTNPWADTLPLVLEADGGEKEGAFVADERRIANRVGTKLACDLTTKVFGLPLIQDDCSKALRRGDLRVPGSLWAQFGALGADENVADGN